MDLLANETNPVAQERFLQPQALELRPSFHQLHLPPNIDQQSRPLTYLLKCRKLHQKLSLVEQPHPLLHYIWCTCSSSLCSNMADNVHRRSGLPKDPATWSLADQNCSIAHSEGAVPLFFRPELLGTSCSGERLIPDVGVGKSKKPSKRSYKSKLDGFKVEGEAELSASEILKIQAKAMKLAFPRDVEIVSSTIAPPSTLHVCHRLFGLTMQN